ncbi:hypothetical protein C0U44_29800 [Klebsiella pneumoniae]|nr:hypothetical protein C0U44_29800 [Klebsiella pneumoniae]
MGSCAAPSAKGDDKFITTDYLQQCPEYWYPEQLALTMTSPIKCFINHGSYFSFIQVCIGCFGLYGC